ncbi:MAG: nucleotidyltransferase family protein, partial [Planctomycetales bacterium]|nr:nucleotidyltransferase family protein [Planctomycetales bacterium]
MKQHPDFTLTRELRWLCPGIQSADETRQAQALRDMIETLGTAEAYKLAERNDVACIVGHAADRGTLANEVAAPFALAHTQTMQRIARYMARLDHVAETLAARGIPLVALKNAGIARGIHGCYGCCPMGDVDVLVRRSDFCESHRALVELGYQFEFRSPLEMADT